MAFLSQRQQHGNRAKKITRRLAARNLRFLLKYVDRDSQSELWDKALATSKQTSIVYFPLGNGKASAAQPFFRLCGSCARLWGGPGKGTEFMERSARTSAAAWERPGRGKCVTYEMDKWGTFCSCAWCGGGRKKGGAFDLSSESGYFSDSRRYTEMVHQG